MLKDFKKEALINIKTIKKRRFLKLNFNVDILKILWIS